jgi:hypothetical protein
MEVKMKYFLLIIFSVFSSHLLAQSFFYGYDDCKKALYDQKNNINGMGNMQMNSGIVENPDSFKTIVDNSISGKKLLVNLTDYFRTVPIGGRPMIDNLTSSTDLSDLVTKLGMNTDKYRNALLGFYVEEPLAHATQAMSLGQNIFDTTNLKFAVKGDFWGGDHLDDLALIYAASNSHIIIKVLKCHIPTNAANNDIFDTTPIVYLPDTFVYSYSMIRKVVAGDYNNDGIDDLAIFYQYSDKWQVHIWYSNGSDSFGTNYQTSYINYNSPCDLSGYKYIVSGNFNGVDGDELALFYRSSTNSKIFRILPNSGIDTWFDNTNSNWDINMVRGVTTGNFNGAVGSGNNTDEIAVLYDYPSVDSSRIEVFSYNTSDTLVCDNWYKSPYSEINFNNTKWFYSGDFNFDGNDDIVIFDYNYYSRARKFKSSPSNSTYTRFQNIWISRRDCSSPIIDDFQFNNIKYCFVGNFYNHVSSEARFTDATWTSNGIDDILYFDKVENYGLLEFTKPHLSFSSKERLALISSRVKAVFGNYVNPVKTAILYMEPSTYIPNVFETSYDWIGTDVYPSSKNNIPTGYPGVNSFYSGGNYWYSISDTNRINRAVRNIDSICINNKIFIIGLSALGLPSSYPERYPSAKEAYQYYRIAKAYSKVVGLYWWDYRDHLTPSREWYGVGHQFTSSSDTSIAASNLKAEHIVIGNLLSSLFKQSSEYEDENSIPVQFELSQNYPNPFNPTTTIKYSIPENSYVSLNIYNILGQEVSELVNNYQASGSYSVNFNSSGLSSGIYFYKLTAGSNTQVNKMLLLK